MFGRTPDEFLVSIRKCLVKGFCGGCKYYEAEKVLIRGECEISYLEDGEKLPVECADYCSLWEPREY